MIFKGFPDHRQWHFFLLLQYSPQGIMGVSSIILAPTRVPSLAIESGLNVDSHHFSFVTFIRKHMLPKWWDGSSAEWVVLEGKRKRLGASKSHKPSYIPLDSPFARRVFFKNSSATRGGGNTEGAGRERWLPAIVINRFWCTFLVSYWPEFVYC